MWQSRWNPWMVCYDRIISIFEVENQEQEHLLFGIVRCHSIVVQCYAVDDDAKDATTPVDVVAASAVAVDCEQEEK